MTEQQVAYKFDLVAVATVSITTAAGEDAARQAARAIEAIEPGHPVDVTEDVVPDAKFEILAVAPRGNAYLVDVEQRPGQTAAGGLDENIPEPLTGDWRGTLKGALDEADEALGGDSNDAEHDALYSIRETIAGLLGIDTDPPSPGYDMDEHPE